MTLHTTIHDLKDYVGQSVTVSAWLTDKSGKGKIQFLHRVPGRRD